MSMIKTPIDVENDIIAHLKNNWSFLNYKPEFKARHLIPDDNMLGAAIPNNQNPLYIVVKCGLINADPYIKGHTYYMTGSVHIDIIGSDPNIVNEAVKISTKILMQKIKNYIQFIITETNPIEVTSDYCRITTHGNLNWENNNQPDDPNKKVESRIKLNPSFKPYITFTPRSG